MQEVECVMESHKKKDKQVENESGKNISIFGGKSPYLVERVHIRV